MFKNQTEDNSEYWESTNYQKRGADKRAFEPRTKRPVKRPNLTQEEILILKQAWAQECPQGAVHSL